jgi:ribitol 2-dehydrogenase
VSEALEGKVAVVTGASSGIGLAIAQALAGAGAHVVLAARSADRVASAVATIGVAATGVVTDVTSSAGTERLIAAAVERHGHLDIVVANAGVYVGGELAGSELDRLVTLVDTNVTGVVRIVHAALAHMLPAGKGDIVITNSVSGYQAIHWEPVYSASKHALRSLAHGLRRQLAATGIRVGSIAPGVVENDLWIGTEGADVVTGLAAGEGLRSEDVADAVLYMLSRPAHVTVRDLVLLPTRQEI